MPHFAKCQHVTPRPKQESQATSTRPNLNLNLNSGIWNTKCVGDACVIRNIQRQNYINLFFKLLNGICLKIFANYVIYILYEQKKYLENNQRLPMTQCRETEVVLIAEVKWYSSAVVEADQRSHLGFFTTFRVYLFIFALCRFLRGSRSRVDQVRIK